MLEAVSHSIPIGKSLFLENVFSSEQWDQITELVHEIASQTSLLEKISYGKGALENTKFSLSIYKFITRVNGVSFLNNSIYTIALLAIIEKSSLMSQIATLNGKTLTILRMQLNLMTTGGYVGRHTDYESDHAYCCSLLIRIGDNYKGGGLIIYDENGTANSINQCNRTILAMSSHSAHEVAPVESGIRYTICLFCG